MPWWIRSEVRGCLSQEGQVLVLLGHLPAQPEELGALGGVEWLTAARLERLYPLPLVAELDAQRILKHRELSGDRANRATGVDHAVGRLGPELEGEPSPSCSHGDILPADL